MPIGSHAKLKEIKVWDAIGTKGALDLKRVCLGSGIPVRLLTGHAMYLAGRDRYMAQQYLLGHEVVAVFIVGWNTSFI